MGERLFAALEWVAVYGRAPGTKAMDQVGDFPWDMKVLRDPEKLHLMAAETHVAFLGLDRLKGEPLTIMRWQRLYPKLFALRVHGSSPWYAGGEFFFTQNPLRLGWHLMRSQPLFGYEVKGVTVENSLPPNCNLPSAIEEVSRLILFRDRGLEPAPGYVWTSDMVMLSNQRRRVVVGLVDGKIMITTRREYEQAWMITSCRLPNPPHG